MASSEGLKLVRFLETKHFDGEILDCYIPSHERTTTLFYGEIVSNSGQRQPYFGRNVGGNKDGISFNLTYNGVPLGHSNAVHTHPGLEIFIPLNGIWELELYGKDGKESLYSMVCNSWDIVTVPMQYGRTIKNVYSKNKETRISDIATFLYGKPSVIWASHVIEEARKNGAKCDDYGNLLLSSNGNNNNNSNYKEANYDTFIGDICNSKGLTRVKKHEFINNNIFPFSKVWKHFDNYFEKNGNEKSCFWYNYASCVCQNKAIISILCCRQFGEFNYQFKQKGCFIVLRGSWDVITNDDNKVYKNLFRKDIGSIDKIGQKITFKNTSAIQGKNYILFIQENKASQSKL